MDKTAALAIAQEYANEVIKEMAPERVLLFGSYANGGVNEESDIDIAVIFNGFKGDWFKACTKLSSITWKVSTYIEPVLLDIQDETNEFLFGYTSMDNLGIEDFLKKLKVPHYEYFIADHFGWVFADFLKEVSARFGRTKGTI